MPAATLPAWYVAQWMPNGGILEFSVAGPVTIRRGVVSFLVLSGAAATGITLVGTCTVLQNPVQSQIDYIRQQAIVKPNP